MNVKAEDSTPLILGTAGHIDHGKSALIKTLTGTDPDRLEEEKRRGITIELGFAQLILPDGRAMGVIDVPGHERFVRQMIAGATGIDVALLCIAADDGIMPQTVEHLRVLELLGVQNVVVALTKTDLVDEEWLSFIQEEVAARLQTTPYAHADIVPVSAYEKRGIDELLEAIANAARSTRRSHGGADEAARLPIDRAFTIKGSGTVATGTLWSGRIAVGDELELLPGGKRVRVRGVQEHGEAIDTAEAGSRTAINLASIGTDEVHPGMFLATPDTIAPTDRFDAWLVYLGAADDVRPLATGSTVRVSHGTAEVPGRILLMDGREDLAPGAADLVQIRLDEPLPVSRGDRFIIRTFSPVEVVGGGSVLLCHPRRRTTLRTAEQSMLRALKDRDDLHAIDEALELCESLASASSVADSCGLPVDTCAARLEQLEAEGNVVSLPAPKAGRTFYANPRSLASLRARVENTLMKYHALNPDKTGVGKAELARLIGGGFKGDAFDAVLEHLREKGSVLIEGGEVSHPKAGAGAKLQERQTADELARILQTRGLTPPTIASLAQEQEISLQRAHRALGVLEESGKAKRIGEYYFDTQAIAYARTIIESHIAEHGPSNAADLKEALGVTRKHAIPLLEYFDAQGVTRREGDVRLLAK